MIIKFTPNDKGNPPGKLADAEIHFKGTGRAFDPVYPPIEEILDGMKLIGIAIWERRGKRTVTFPARSYSVNGERRSFALLRPIVDATAPNKIRDLILDAFAKWEADQAQEERLLNAEIAQGVE